MESKDGASHVFSAETTQRGSVGTTQSVREKNSADTAPVSGRRVLAETDPNVVPLLGFAFPTWKKWLILSVIFLVQCSMNFNTSLYANGQKGMAAEFGVSQRRAVDGAALFLVLYAFGCELWAPWSEELGRWWVMQLSLFLVNLMAIPVATASNIGTVLAGRTLGGLFSAGGSITLGIVADMYTPDMQEYAVAFVVLSSVGGSIFGPIVGGFVEEYLNWRWTIYLQIIFGVSVQLLHGFLVPETRSTAIMDKFAKKKRREDVGYSATYGPGEETTWRELCSPRRLFPIWLRPFKMFFTEPIVLVLSLLSGFSDALIFMGFQSFGRVYELWSFGPKEVGLTFFGIGLGYLIAYLSFIPAIKRNKALRAQDPNNEFFRYEARLWWLMYTAPCLPIGLLIFAWTSNANLPWIAPVIGTAVIGVANYAVYMATIDYMVAAYGEYAASATGGNGFARDFLAGVLTWAANPYYDAFQRGNEKLYRQLSNTALAGVSTLLVAATVWVYFKGPTLRAKSKFAQSLKTEHPEVVGLGPNSTAANAEGSAVPGHSV